jgi:hypothetical protein
MGTKVIIVADKATGKMVHTTLSTLQFPESLEGSRQWMTDLLKDLGLDVKQVKKVVFKPF